MGAIATIGHNQPPGAIELARPALDALGQFLKDFPVIANEDEAREAKSHLDRVRLALDAVEAERKARVDPLNKEIREVNSEYHKWHNADANRPAIWDKFLAELRSRLSAFARAEEGRRREAAEAAQRAKDEAERLAREAEQREREAAAEAAQGVCDVDIGAATEEADAAFSAFRKADRISQRALRNTKVRIGGGFGKVATLRNREILTVTDWRAAIDEMSDDGEPPTVIAEAILSAARAYRKACGELPAGISQEFDRSL